MPTAACTEAIKKEKPPVTCSEAFCIKIRERIDKYCHKSQLPTDTPVPQEENGQECWCCCSCFAYDTPIEVSEGSFALIQDLWSGDKVRATGPDVSQWEEKEVTYVGGMGPDIEIDFMFHTAYSYGDGPVEVRFIITTSDHLLLMSSGKLKAIQFLAPGDELRRADGGIARVLFNVPGQYRGGVRHIALGDFDGKDLNGHLMNSNGIISADFGVQAHYVANNLTETLLEELPDDAAQAGTGRYRSMYPSPEAEQFLGDKQAWPKGFIPHAHTLLNIPATAYSFLTQAQAEDIEQAHAHDIYASNNDLMTLRYLYKLLNTLFPNITYLVDWENELPNAYAWEQYGEKFVVVTGGLSRSKEIRRNGLSLIVSTLLAYHDGNKCVGPADYEGAFQFMRQLWFGDLYFSAFNGAYEEVSAFFSLISAANSKENPDNICAQPSIECRLQTYKAAKIMDDLPACATPKAEALELVSAAASPDRRKVTVTFNRPLDPPTAQTSANYTVDPKSKVAAAKLDPKNDTVVVLNVAALRKNTQYTLKVANVTSIDNKPLDPDHSSVTFKVQ